MPDSSTTLSVYLSYLSNNKKNNQFGMYVCSQGHQSPNQMTAIQITTIVVSTIEHTTTINTESIHRHIDERTSASTKSINDSHHQINRCTPAIVKLIDASHHLIKRHHVITKPTDAAVLTKTTNTKSNGEFTTKPFDVDTTACHIASIGMIVFNFMLIYSICFEAVSCQIKECYLV